ncbi:hypothetical protein OEZ86_013208 [Tetradesmus obliquus]|nr:hypothetical protein OEZ86_013208 [Tetradesmus obliquus]
MRTPRNKHGDVLPPGFNEDITYQQGNRIKSISTCGRGHPTFLSLDQSALHVFSRPPLDPDHIEVQHTKALQRPNFVSAVCHAVPTGLGAASGVILAACLDCSLKVYAMEKMRLRSSMTWTCGVVTALLYNSHNDTIITAGAAGVKLWGSKADCEGYAHEKALPASDRPWLSAAGEVVPWCYGRFQQAQELLTYQVPGLKTKLTAADMAVPDAGDISWVSDMQLLAQQQLLLVMFQADVYGYDAASGARLYSWRGLAQQPLVSMAFLAGQQQLVTAAREPTIAVWQLQQGGRLDRLCSLGCFAAGAHCVAPAAGRPWLLSASLDGFVVAWSTDSWQQLFRMKLPEAVGSIQFYKPDHFLCLAGNMVKFFKLRQAAQPWMSASCALTSLEPAGHGLLMATFSDSSIRLLDASSTCSDRSALTTVPQLSSAGLLKAAADLAGGRLFALLSNGHVHVWELHLTRPPVLQEAWTHLERERCCSIAFMQGASMDAAAARSLGLSVREAAPAAAKGADPQAAGQDTAAPAAAAAEVMARGVTEDHLFIGTAKGEVLVCDASRQGLLVLRVPVLKLLPVSLLLLDAARNCMVVAGGSVVRLWDLASLTCIAELEASHQLLCGHIMDGVLLLGSSCGRCHMLSLDTGRSVSAAAAPQTAAAASSHGGSNGSGSSGSSGDHDGPVTCISGNSYLQHFVTCSRDGYVKLFGLDRRLRASIYLGTPLAAAAFLNDSGDLLVAPAGAGAAAAAAGPAGAAGALLVVRGDSYAGAVRQ